MKSDPAVIEEGASHRALPPPSLPERVVAGTKGTFPRWWVAGVMAGIGVLTIWRHYEPHIITGPVLTDNGAETTESDVSLSAANGVTATAAG